eukprot:m51a1_g5449 hypothetical protein (88) ;mRNA; f:206392-206655
MDANLTTFICTGCGRIMPTPSTCGRAHGPTPSTCSTAEDERVLETSAAHRGPSLHVKVLNPLEAPLPWPTPIDLTAQPRDDEDLPLL